MEISRESGQFQSWTSVPATSQENISHRKLSPAEARAIWTILNSAASLNSIHELRIVLKPEQVNGARGWIICTE